MSLTRGAELEEILEFSSRILSSPVRVKGGGDLIWKIDVGPTPFL
jgi:hypothetical protein